MQQAKPAFWLSTAHFLSVAFVIFTAKFPKPTILYKYCIASEELLCQTLSLQKGFHLLDSLENLSYPKFAQIVSVGTAHS